jgi:hypothetical protein
MPVSPADIDGFMVGNPQQYLRGYTKIRNSKNQQNYFYYHTDIHFSFNNSIK